jgi:hypothetical protein
MWTNKFLACQSKDKLDSLYIHTELTLVISQIVIFAVNVRRWMETTSEE